MPAKALMCFYLWAYIKVLYRVCLKRAFSLSCIAFLTCYCPPFPSASSILAWLPHFVSRASPGVHSINTSFCVFVFSSHFVCVCFPCVFSALCCSTQQLMMICVLFPLLHYKCPVLCYCCCCCCRHCHRFDYLGFNLYICSIVVVAFFPPLLALLSAVIVSRRSGNCRHCWYNT